MSEGLQHVLRMPIPWRHLTQSRTECGLTSDAVEAIPFEEMQAKVRREGEKRAAYSSCMTCWEAAGRHHQEMRWLPDGVDPILLVIAREIAFVRRREGDALRFSRELRALTMLAERYRDEFIALVDDMEGSVNLTAYRKSRAGTP